MPYEHPVQPKFPLFHSYYKVKLIFVKMGFAVTIMYTVHQAPVVRKVDNAIHSINLFPVDEAIDFPITYPLNSNLSGGKHYPTLN